MKNLLSNDNNTSFDSLLDDVILYLFDNNLTLSEIVYLRLLSKRYQTLIDRFYHRYIYYYYYYIDTKYIDNGFKICIRNSSIKEDINIYFYYHSRLMNDRYIRHVIKKFNENKPITNKLYINNCRDSYDIFIDKDHLFYIELDYDEDYSTIKYNDEGILFKIDMDEEGVDCRHDDFFNYIIGTKCVFTLKNNKIGILRFLHLLYDLNFYTNLFFEYKLHKRYNTIE